MVNNSTHINKTKESLNSDGQQFHPYQQYEQSPLTSTQWTQRRPRQMELDIQSLSWDRDKHVMRLNQQSQIIESIWEEVNQWAHNKDSENRLGIHVKRSPDYWGDDD
jgi:hypothetical protein